MFTLLEPVPQGLWASYHLFGLLSFGQGLSTTIVTLSAAACVRKQTSFIKKLDRKEKKLCVCIFTGPDNSRAVLPVLSPHGGVHHRHR